jgi:hypothetical protein
MAPMLGVVLGVFTGAAVVFAALGLAHLIATAWNRRAQRPQQPPTPPEASEK